MKLVPHPYQLVACRFLVKRPEAALFLDVGLGKTSVTLLAYTALRKAKAASKMLIIAPLRVCSLVWPAEVAKWEQFQNLRVAVLHGNEKEDHLEEDADIYVVNHDGLAWLTGRISPAKTKTRLDALLERGVDTLVLDELSKFKHSNTQRFKTLRKYLPRFTRRWGLTGSPAANGLLDLFGQCYVLDLGKALGQYITHYRYTYFMSTGYGGYTWVPQPDADKRIYAKIADLALSMKATDHLEGLPTLVEQDVWVDLPEKARAFYDELEREMIAEMDGARVTVQSAAALSGKCRQAASGGVYVLRRTNVLGTEVSVDDFKSVRETVHVHDAKTEALVDMVE